MNPLELFLFLAFLIYTLLYRLLLFIIYLFLLIVYAFISQKWMKPNKEINDWARKQQQCNWNGPNEGAARLVADVDCTAAMDYVKKLSQKTGEKITITHLLVKALGIGIRHCKKAQGYIKWGNFYPESKLDVTLVVNVQGGTDLAMIRVQNPDKQSIESIAKQANQKADKARRKKDQDHKKRVSSAHIFPTFILQLSCLIIGYIVSSLRMAIPIFGFKGGDFGTCLVSNVGVFGMKKGYAPLFPIAHIGLGIAMGTIQKRATVCDDRIQIRDRITITFTADHRYGDAAVISEAYKTIEEYFKDPQAFESSIKPEQ